MSKNSCNYVKFTGVFAYARIRRKDSAITIPLSVRGRPAGSLTVIKNDRQ